MTENLKGALIGALIAVPIFGSVIWFNIRWMKMQWRMMHALEHIASNLGKLALELKNR